MRTASLLVITTSMFFILSGCASAADSSGPADEAVETHVALDADAGAGVTPASSKICDKWLDICTSGTDPKSWHCNAWLRYC